MYKVKAERNIKRSYGSTLHTSIEAENKKTEKKHCKKNKTPWNIWKKQKKDELNTKNIQIYTHSKFSWLNICGIFERI